MRGRSALKQRVLAIVALVACACAEHEPEVERRGGPLPDPMPPPSCVDGGAPSETIEFCQANIVLDTVCQICHADPPMHGAPFPLVSYEDTQEVFDTRDGKLRWQRMLEVVEADLMPAQGIPEAPVDPLNCSQKSTLLGWLEQCARPVGGTDCSAGGAELLACSSDNQ